MKQLLPLLGAALVSGTAIAALDLNGWRWWLVQAACWGNFCFGLWYGVSFSLAQLKQWLKHHDWRTGA